MNNTKIIIENADKQLNGLFHEIISGEIKIPQFQRQFVWSMNASASLLDSILKSYPIGSFIYWRTDESLRSVRSIGNLILNEKAKGEQVNYILDGQQRITSIFAAIRGEKVLRENNKFDDFSLISIDLHAEGDEPIVVVLTEKNRDTNRSYISVKDLMGDQISRLAKNRDDDEINKIERYRSIISSYKFTGVQIKNANIDVATEIFTRLNTNGKTLDLFEIMVAKTYDQDRDFDLYSKYDELSNSLDEIGYGSVSRSIVLFLSCAIASHKCTKQGILQIKKDIFIDNWEDVCLALKNGIDFLRAYGIPTSSLLPYDSLLVPISYFFYKQPKTISNQMQTLLSDFFWRTSLTNRYSSALEGKLSEDLDKIDMIIKGEIPNYTEFLNLSQHYIRQNGYFVSKNAFIKSFLALYVINNPRSFKNNMKVNVDGSTLNKNNSKNYHHFFPLNHMKTNHDYIKYDHYHNVINITIVEDYINKGEIKDKAPRVYIKNFADNNPDLQKTLQTHFIGDTKTFGIDDDDYIRFFNERLKLIRAEIISRIIPKDGDILED